MQRTTMDLWVGLFVILGVGSLLILSLKIGNLNTYSAGQSYQLISNFENIGGLVMPLIVEFEYTGGTKEIRRIPAEIWKMLPHQEVTKVFVTEKEVRQITLDPYLETADTDTGNNYFPARQSLNRFEMYQQKEFKKQENPMQRAARDKKN